MAELQELAHVHDECPLPSLANLATLPRFEMAPGTTSDKAALFVSLVFQETIKLVALGRTSEVTTPRFNSLPVSRLDLISAPSGSLHSPMQKIVAGQNWNRLEENK